MEEKKDIYIYIYIIIYIIFLVLVAVTKRWMIEAVE